MREKTLYDLLVTYLPPSDFKISSTSLYILVTPYSDHIIKQYLLSHGIVEKFKKVKLEKEEWYKIDQKYRLVVYPKL